MADNTQVEFYDLKGLNCPLPVLKSAKRLSAMRAGDRLWVETTDPLAAIDIPAFCHERGHILIATEKTATGHSFLIKRGKLPRPMPRAAGDPLPLEGRNTGWGSAG